MATTTYTCKHEYMGLGTCPDCNKKVKIKENVMLSEGIEIKEEDLRILSTRLFGYIPANANGIRVVHLPTKIEVECSTERSQQINRAKALQELALLLKERQTVREKPTFQEGQAVWVASKDGTNKYKAIVIATGEHFTCVHNYVGIPSMEKKEIVENERVFALGYDRVKTIRIGEFDVPEPLREAPKKGTIIYFVTLLYCTLDPSKDVWRGSDYQYKALKAGLLQLTKEAAFLQADAMLSELKE